MRELIQRRLALLFFSLVFRLLRLGRARLGLRRLGDAVRDEIHQIEAAYFLLIEKENSMRILFAKDSHQNIGPRHFLAT